MGIPRIPIARLLPASVICGRRVSFAFPEGYLVFVQQAEKLVRIRRDIVPLRHAFIGERTRDGYGEIMVYPALDSYYRSAEQRIPERYSLEFPVNFRSVNISTELIHRALELNLQRKVISLAVVDQRDVHYNGRAPSSIPLDLLRNMRDHFDPYISDEKLIQWYLDGLEMEGNGFFY